MSAIRMRTDATARKVLGATAGAGVAGAITTIVIWIIEHPGVLGVNVPADVAAAMTTVIAAVATYYAGYNTLPSAEDQIVAVPDAAVELALGPTPPMINAG